MKVKIEKLDNYGRGICYVNDKICFVENSLPNEIIEIEITNEKAKYLEAIPTKWIEKSPLRMEEDCPYSSICGGCDLNHFCFNEENKFKKDKIKDLLFKYCQIDSNIIEPIKYHDRNHYRNKGILHGKDGQLGFYKKNTNEIIPIQDCLLLNPKINETLKRLNTIPDELEEVLIKTTNDNSKVLLSIKGNVSSKESYQKISDVLIINDEYITKEKDLITTIGDKKYHESANSFFQVNNTLTKELYDEVKINVMDKNYKKALDLYCGTGTIGIYISEYVERLIGIDNNKSNIEDAIKNKELNHVNNIEFICDKVENKIDSFQNIDLIIIDPPRAGLDEKTRKNILEINPKEIIYVSCDVLSLSRDLKELQQKYEIKKIVPFNMFPRTKHCESITVLERK